MGPGAEWAAHALGVKYLLFLDWLLIIKTRNLNGSKERSKHTHQRFKKERAYIP